MPAFKIILLAFFYVFDSLVSGSKCPEDAISKLVVCYFEEESPLTNLNFCNCTHLILTKAVRKTENNSINATEDAIGYLDIIKEKKKNLTTIFTLELRTDDVSVVLKSENKSNQLINSIVNFLQTTQFDGVELNFKFSSDDGVTKESYASFVKNLSKTLKSNHRRVKREGYDVFETLQGDITTVAYTTQTPKNSTSKTQSIKQTTRKTKESNRKTREKKDEDDADYLTLEEAINAEFNEEKQNSLQDLEENAVTEKKLVVFVRMSVQPEIIAKKYDLKSISRYADILIVPTHNIVNKDEEHLTYHPSRLMGLSDVLNTDSVLDFLTGMGGLKSKMVISLPAAVLKFQLKDKNKNTPRSPTVTKPQVIDQSQLCGLFSKSNWTLERDDDLTAPYAFSGETWLAFEDEISVNIKGKYILLRELAGGAIYPIDFDLNDGSCNNRTGSSGYLTGILHKNFERMERKPRALVLESLQDEIHDLPFINAKDGVQVSEFRIVRVVDHAGAVHVIRKNTKTQFECSRQGYFSHPLGCNKFYRCVKFNQYSDEFTVFEYDCPAGLAFDERWEVCVWPGSLPHGAPCTGSSEIAPVPRSHYQCPNHEGYFADPENCRWFFACLDHARDGITPLTAYEFRCPFGLVFSEEKLACDWPWLVGSCGNRGAAGYLNINAATFINGGNLEASFGQYDNLDQRASFIGFGQKFGSVLKESEQNSYQGAQSAGYGYIASQSDDNSKKASLAAFPDYEISGGRIFNKDGVVLKQSIAGIVGNLETINIRGDSSRELKNLAGEYFQQGINITPEIRYQRLEPASTTVKTNILQASGRQTSILTPKPFSVHIPSVQINEEFSIVGSTTPQTLVSAEVPLFTNNQQTIKQYPTPRGFTATAYKQPATVSVTTPAPEVHTLRGFEQSLSGIPKTETHEFGQTRQNEFSNKLPAVTAEVPVVVQSFGYSSGASDGRETSIFTPKPDVHTFEYTANGHEINQPFESTETAFDGLKITHLSTRRGSGKSVTFIDFPALQTFNNNKEQDSVIIKQSGAPLVAVTPSITTSGSFQSSIDDKVSNEIKLNKPQTTFSVPDIISKTGSEQLNLVSNKISQVTSKPDFHIFSQSGLSSNVEAGKSQATFSYNLPAVTPKPNINLPEYNREHLTQTVSLVSPEVTSAAKNNFQQTGIAGISKEFSKAYSIPLSISQSNGFEFSSSLQEKEGKKFFSIPLETSQIKNDVQTQKIFHDIFKPTDAKFPQIDEPIQSGFGQRYSYSSSFKQSGSRIGSIQSFGSVSSTAKPALVEEIQVLPKIQELKKFAEVNIDPQPGVLVETVSLGVADHTLSTPPPYSTFESSGLNLKSTSAQPQVFTVTTPETVALVTASAGLSGVNIIDPNQTIGLKETGKINLGSDGPGAVSFPEKINLNQKSHFKVETKSFSPITHMTTPVPTNIAKSFYDKTSAFLAPIQHISVTQYENDRANRILVEEKESKPSAESIETKFEEKIISFAPHQSQVQITTAAPAYQPSLRQAFVTSRPFTPREQLVGLEISKSIEVNPDEFFQTTEKQVPVKPIQIQQPLEFIFPTKQSLTQQGFPTKQSTLYKHQEIVNIQDKNFDYGHTEQQSPKTEILEQKQYLFPPVISKPIINSFSKAKTVERPAVYSGGVFPRLETLKAPLAVKTDTKQYLPASGFVKSSDKTVFVDQYEKQQSVAPRLSISLPTSTVPPQYTPSVAEELTVQTHKNFDSKKINTFGRTPLQSAFIPPEAQSTLRPAVDIFQSSEVLKHNLTLDLKNRFKYPVNPNIEIPEPPEEYILVQNGYTTRAPALSTARSQLHSTTESFNRFGSSTFYAKPTEGNLNEEVIHEGNVQLKLFEKYSGRFGQLNNGNNNNGQVEGSSTVRNEVSSTTSRPETRGRLYHGDITSGKQATNKYEEYDINEERSLETEKEGNFKTIIDLKNVKVDKNKKTVIVVSQVSDANPILIGKLAGQCSCQSNMLELKTKGKKSKAGARKKNKSLSAPQHSIITNEYLPPFEGSQSKIGVESPTLGAATNSEPETVIIGGLKPSYSEQNLVSSSTTTASELVSSKILSSFDPDRVLAVTPKTLFVEEKIRNKSKQFRGRTRYLPPSSLHSEDVSSETLLSPVPASEIASTFDYSVLKGYESRTHNEINGERGAGAGAAFDRYGPGGWRSFDETLQGSIDCKRPGLFRHPKHCNKFYACNYDPWKEQFTLHVFNCPIHLTYDSSISACNWPVRGPACADDNLLV